MRIAGLDGGRRPCTGRFHNHPIPPTTQALSRALLPGWGQLYNRQFAKIPVVYAGLGIFGGAALNTNRKYRLYGHAYLFTAREDGSGLPIFPQYAEDYARLLFELGLPPEGSLTPEEVIRRRARSSRSFGPSVTIFGVTVTYCTSAWAYGTGLPSWTPS